MFTRIIENKIKENFFKQRGVIIYGARQVGKTTLLKKIMAGYETESIFLNCDEPDIREILTAATSTKLRELFGNKKIVFIDEAQRVPDIGITLKIIIDTFKDVQVVASGSSALELSNSIMEPLTGRAYEFCLYPFSVEELLEKYSKLEFKRILENRLIYGSYPDVINYPNEAETILRSVANNYLYKDLLKFQNIRRSDILEKLVRALALQIGNEVSFSELSGMIGIAKQTVERYIQFLEQCFVIFRLRPFNKNLRTELTKKCKIFFFDNGIRNALINNFNLLSFRNDIGALWENFLLAERVKFNTYRGFSVNSYFWRTHQQQEVDYLEERNLLLSAYEFKYNKDTFHIPSAFKENYPDAAIKLINKDNMFDFFSDDKQ